MKDNAWISWLIVAVIAIGGIFELIKNIPSSKSPLFDKENLRYSSEEDAPYSVKIANNGVTQSKDPRPVHVAANKALQEEMKKFTAANEPKQTEAEHKDATAKADGKKTAEQKKADDDEWEHFIDPVTGKKMKRKKKKKDAAAKKDDKLLQAVKQIDLKKPVQVDPSSVDQNHAIGAALQDLANGRPINPPLPPENPDRDNGPQSLQEWQRQLLGRPNLAETREFIRDFKSKNVSADTYYKIAQQMIQDSRPEMKQLGVMVAGSAPSATSFTLLAGVARSPSSSATLKQQATQQLNAYSQPQNLIYLQGVMRGSDKQSATMAAQILDTAVQQALQHAQTNPNPGGLDPRYQNSSLSSNRTTFRPFVPILTQLSNNTQDPTLAAQAQQTLHDLQALLSYGTPSNVAVTP